MISRTIYAASVLIMPPLLASAQAPAPAEDPAPENKIKYVREIKRQRQAEIKWVSEEVNRLNAMLTMFQRGTIDKSVNGIEQRKITKGKNKGKSIYAFQSGEHKGAYIGRVKSLIEKYEGYLTQVRTNVPPFVPVIRFYDLAVGRIGVFDTQYLKHISEAVPEVVQVIDQENMVIVFNYAYSDLAPGKTAETGVSRPVFIKGFSTTNLVDGSKVELTGLFEITGTTLYTTAEEKTMTVFLAQPFDFDYEAYNSRRTSIGL